jgi:hypothetical protein
MYPYTLLLFCCVDISLYNFPQRASQGGPYGRDAEMHKHTEVSQLDACQGCGNSQADVINVSFVGCRYKYILNTHLFDLLS